MTQRVHKDLKQIVHPYIFVLKEGVEFREDCLDYSLMMLHVNCLEVLASPHIKSSLTIAETVSPAVSSDALQSVR